MHLLMARHNQVTAATGSSSGVPVVRGSSSGAWVLLSSRSRPVFGSLGPCMGNRTRFQLGGCCAPHAPWAITASPTLALNGGSYLLGGFGASLKPSHRPGRSFSLLHSPWLLSPCWRKCRPFVSARTKPGTLGHRQRPAYVRELTAVGLLGRPMLRGFSHGS